MTTSARLPRERRLDRNWEMPSDTDSFGHRQPASTESERALLGAALLDGSVMAQVGDMLAPEDFYTTKHGDIWGAMQTLYHNRDPIDIVTVREQLGDHPSVDPSLLADLLNGTPSAHHAPTYAGRIRNASRRRNLIRTAADISVIGYEELDSSEAEEKAKQLILHALDNSESKQRIMTPDEQGALIVSMMEDRLEGRAPALATGYPSLDAATNGGFRGGELVVIAARTSVGKSSYAENIAEQVAKHQNIVLYFNLEMSAKRMMERFAKRSHKLSTSAFLDGPTHEKDIAAMYEIAEQRSKMPITLVNDGMASASSIWGMVNQHVIRHGSIELIVIDYLQLLKDKERKSGSEVQRIAGITSSLKALAMEHEVPVILISQLNRNVEHRGGEPELHDLRDSGAIEQDADIVLLMWRDDEDEVKIKIGKQRDGPTPELPIWFDGASFTFTEPKGLPDSPN